MIAIFNKVAKWNEARFDRVYNDYERHDLLREEYLEWVHSDDQVNDAKELLDIIYVAMGGVWALDITVDAEEHQSAHSYVNHAIDQSILMPGFMIGALLDQNAVVGHNQMQLMHCIIGLALAQLQLSGIEDANAVKALNILCNSNASKDVEKNVLKPVKGDSFKPAEPQLRTLMEKIGCLQKAH